MITDQKGIIKRNETEYPVVFNLNVIEEIQRKYGSIEKWINRLSSSKENVDIKCIKWSFGVMINEGIDIENEEKGESRPFVNEKQVGRIISGLENNGIKEIFSIFTESMPTSTEENDPNS